MTPQNTIKVLVVEDEVLVRMDIVTSLEEQGFKSWKQPTPTRPSIFSMSIPISASCLPTSICPAARTA
jgi:CheY-like chemotaxis protein